MWPKTALKEAPDLRMSEAIKLGVLTDPILIREQVAHEMPICPLCGARVAVNQWNAHQAQEHANNPVRIDANPDQFPMGAISANELAQPRLGLDTETVERYAEAIRDGAVLPPIVLFYDAEKGMYYLADGFHRRAAYRVLGRTTINVVIRKGTLRDAILHSVGANAEHGLPRSNEDKRRAVMRLLTDPEWSLWSDREIARTCKVSHQTVANHRKVICQSLTDATPPRLPNLFAMTSPPAPSPEGEGDKKPFGGDVDDVAALHPDTQPSATGAPIVPPSQTVKFLRGGKVVEMDTSGLRKNKVRGQRLVQDEWAQAPSVDDVPIVQVEETSPPTPLQLERGEEEETNRQGNMLKPHEAEALVLVKAAEYDQKVEFAQQWNAMNPRPSAEDEAGFGTAQFVGERPHFPVVTLQGHSPVASDDELQPHPDSQGDAVSRLFAKGKFIPADGDDLLVDYEQEQVNRQAGRRDIPYRVIERAKRVFKGVIDLDACWNQGNQKHAQRTLSPDEGLTAAWGGQVFVHIPLMFTAGKTELYYQQWVDKALHEYGGDGNATAIILLLPADTDSDWAQTLDSEPRCFIRQEHFAKGCGAWMVVYMGGDDEGFARAFSDLGNVFIPYGY